jgi:hypothetical protein
MKLIVVNVGMGHPNDPWRNPKIPPRQKHQKSSRTGAKHILKGLAEGFHGRDRFVMHVSVARLHGTYYHYYLFSVFWPLTAESSATV